MRHHRRTTSAWHRAPADAADGAAAGLVATVAMSAFMFAAQKAGFMGEQPPEQIVESSLGKTDTGEHGSLDDVAAVVLHAVFGGVGGAVYGMLVHRVAPRLDRRISGILYGLLVWIVSYKGWIPSLSLMPRPEHDRPGRPTSMIIAHLIYGGVLGARTGRHPASPH